MGRTDVLLRGDGGDPLAGLDRIPWEGGPAYYESFADAAARGWSDPSFFPIAIWWCVFESTSQVQWDKSLGINTYCVTNPDLTGSTALMDDNGMSWIGGELPNMTRSSPCWVGDFYDDEIDGTITPASAAFAALDDMKAAFPDHDKFRYTNYTVQVINTWMADADAEKFVNDYTDVFSIDQYWLTVPFCSGEPYSGDYYFIQPIPEASCRTANTYGQTMDMLRVRDIADNKRQPIWNYIENVSGSAGDQIGATVPTPAEIKGAAMSSLIHEARGLIWFNNVVAQDASYGSGNCIRDAQTQGESYAGYPQVMAMGDINNQIHALAEVLNTQSYEWTFGEGLDTMLKAYNGYAYIFAMSDAQAGSRTFTLPSGITGGSAEVVDESRTITITDGEFSDTFVVSGYHIYKIAL